MWLCAELGYEVHVVADAVSSSRWLDRAVGLQVTLGPILLAELVLAVFMTKLFRLRIDD